MHRKRIVTNLAWLGAFAISGCATPAPPPEVSSPASLATNDVAPAAPAHILKRKIAVGRFSNETLYGKALLIPGVPDPLEKQTSDMASNALADTGKFVVLERPDLSEVQAEQALSGTHSSIIGADDLVIGSLTQFGRETEGEDGFLSNTKKQVAHATVDLRLVDVKTGEVIFTATGTGEASVENGTVAGFGNTADYDETLNDRAISAAINDVMNNLVEKLDAKPWETDILKVSGDSVYIAGGAHQGITPGTHLTIMQSGGAVTSTQSGFSIPLPGTPIATLTVASNFGSEPESEGSICTITSGTVPATGLSKLYVTADNTP
jgi:curli biogenesis system outer membrane secretion channel CsgG